MTRPDFDREYTLMEINRRIKTHNAAFEDDF